MEVHWRTGGGQEVEALKKKRPKDKLASTIQRSKITSFIAKENRRQDFTPLIGDLVDRVHVEPLYLKNNTCALAHHYLLDLVSEVSNIPSSVSSFSQVNSSFPLAKYVSAMRQNGLSRLAKKVVHCFNNSRKSEKTFDYRSTGKDSRGL